MQIHFQDPEDMLSQVLSLADDDDDSGSSNGAADHSVAEWARRSGHDRLNADLVRKLQERGISYRYALRIAYDIWYEVFTVLFCIYSS